MYIYIYILNITDPLSKYYYIHFTAKETETQEFDITCRVMKQNMNLCA